MGIFNFIGKKNKSKSISEKANILQNRNIEPATKKVSQNTLAEDIKISAEWVKKNMNLSGYKVDYDLDSMKEVDRFFDEQTKEGGLLTGKCGNIIFSLGSFIGETIIKLYGGEWITNDDDPNGEINAEVHTSDKIVCWPIIRCMKRRQNGPEESIYAYVIALDKNSDSDKMVDITKTIISQAKDLKMD